MNRIWNIRKPHPELRESLAKSLKISPITAQILINRNVCDEMQAHHFLQGALSSCHDPNLLKDAKKATSRIEDAIKNKEKILIYGDYDVDGITGVALLSYVLKDLGARFSTYIPNRLEEGYGLNENAVKFAHEDEVSLIITVDCGIGALKEVELANKKRIDVIITDHHEIKTDSIPKAYAVINPHQPSCNYPFKHLSGVGLAYKLCQALLSDRRYPLEEHLDLVALGTVADIAPQIGENRILTKHGLEAVNETKKLGLRALIEIAGLKGKDITCGHIGYILGPRINAMGRIGSPKIALELLVTKDARKALKLAEMLNNENRNRQRIESGIMDEASAMVEREVNFKDHRVLVLAKEGWHAGVIGIIASRIQERFYRPTILIALDGKIGKGSGRSIERFNLFNAIYSCKDLLTDFGGHESACGLSIERKKIDRFKAKINEHAKVQIQNDDLLPKLNIDIDIPLSSLSAQLIEEIENLAPFGPENPRPVFVSRELQLKANPRRIGKNGLKLWVTDEKITCEAITFKSERFTVPQASDILDLAYTPSINTWQGVDSIQLDLKDIK